MTKMLCAIVLLAHLSMSANASEVGLYCPGELTCTAGCNFRTLDEAGTLTLDVNSRSVKIQGMLFSGEYELVHISDVGYGFVLKTGRSSILFDRSAGGYVDRYTGEINLTAPYIGTTGGPVDFVFRGTCSAKKPLF